MNTGPKPIPIAPRCRASLAPPFPLRCPIRGGAQPSPSPREARTGRGPGRGVLDLCDRSSLAERLLSPTLSSVPNGGEGDRSRRASLPPPSVAPEQRLLVGRGVLTAPPPIRDVRVADGGLRTTRPTIDRCLEMSRPGGSPALPGRDALPRVRGLCPCPPWQIRLDQTKSDQIRPNPTYARSRGMLPAPSHS